MTQNHTQRSNKSRTQADTDCVQRSHTSCSDTACGFVSEARVPPVITRCNQSLSSECRLER
eukprot:scaffold5450_cov103-Skeletonema_dohrnii-CCMP3373.AAC.11